MLVVGKNLWKLSTTPNKWITKHFNLIMKHIKVSSEISISRNECRFIELLWNNYRLIFSTCSCKPTNLSKSFFVAHIMCIWGRKRLCILIIYQCLFSLLNQHSLRVVLIENDKLGFWRFHNFYVVYTEIYKFESINLNSIRNMVYVYLILN